MALSERDLCDLLSEQVAYYRARAPEYDQWWTQSGRYNQGPEASARFAGEVAEVYAALDRFHAVGDVLEFASGTGIWTERLVRTAGTVTCVDAAPEMIEINRARLAATGAALPRYITADVFDWIPQDRYDVVCFGFWVSHIPEARWQPFWDKVRTALKPKGRVFFVDEVASDAPYYTPTDADDRQQRTLDDGRRFTIVKRYYAPDALADRLAALGWRTGIQRTAQHFLYGAAWRPQ